MDSTADGLMRAASAACQQLSPAVRPLLSLMFVDRLPFLPGSGPVCDLTVSLLQRPHHPYTDPPLRCRKPRWQHLIFVFNCRIGESSVR